MRRPSILTLALLAGLFTSACERSTPAEPDSAALEITVAPSPLVVRLACPNPTPGAPPPRSCFASLSPTVTLRETGGVGGRIEGIDVTIRVSADESRFVLGSDWMRSHAGTDRLEAMGAVAFQPVVNDYPVPYGPAPTIQFVLAVRFKDDNGHSITQTVQLST